MTYRTTITREKTIMGPNGPLGDGEVEFEIEVEYTAYAASRGARDSLGGKRGAGPPLEPDEPAHVEIESVTEVETGNEIELTSKESLIIEEKIEQAIYDDI